MHKKDTADDSTSTLTSEIVFMSDNLEVIVFAQPPHFRFCTSIEVFIDELIYCHSRACAELVLVKTGNC
mgnify:CR=1 FL=1